MAVPLANNRCRAFFELPNLPCSQCDNPSGTFKCHGCDRAFCEQHVKDHRNALKAELREIRQRNGTLETEFAGQEIFRSESQRLVSEIDAWEAQSIQKIKAIAEEARKMVTGTVNVSGHSQVRQLLECRKVFTERLEQADAHGDFHERHLEFWTQFLEDLKQNFMRLRTSYARIEYLTVPFIAKLIVRETYAMISFTKWCYYQRPCIKPTDIRRAGNQLDTSQFVGIEPCEGFHHGTNEQIVYTKRSEIPQLRNSGQLIEGARDPYYQEYSDQGVIRRTESYQKRSEFHDNRVKTFMQVVNLLNSHSLHIKLFIWTMQESSRQVNIDSASALVVFSLALYQRVLIRDVNH